MASFFRPIALGFSLLLVAAVSEGSASDVRPPWSQAEVVALAQQLSVALDALLADPGLRAAQTTAYQQRSHEAGIATVEQLRPRVADLSKRLAAGSDRDATQPYFDQVAELREEIAAYAAESWLPDSTRTKAVRVRELFERIARYYP